MADEEKPKPMSIKERMAAFQQAANQPAAPPPPVIVAPPEEEKRSRAPGKLFGRSLMDDLEARKAAMRNKQRWAKFIHHLISYLFLTGL